MNINKSKNIRRNVIPVHVLTPSGRDLFLSYEVGRVWCLPLYKRVVFAIQINIFFFFLIWVKICLPPASHLSQTLDITTSRYFRHTVYYVKRTFDTANFIRAIYSGQTTVINIIIPIIGRVLWVPITKTPRYPQYDLEWRIGAFTNGLL